MTHRFSVGQRVRVHCPGSVMHGEVCTIIEGPTFARDTDDHFGSFYTVDLCPGSDGIPWGYEAHELIPIDDEPGSWEALADIWTPVDARAVE